MDQRESGAYAPIAPALVLPFRLRGYDGRVSVYYAEDQEPSHWGFDVPGLLAVPFDLSLALGFPICEARVAYDGLGYRALMGWIQMITHRDAATGVEEESSVDLVPMHDDLNTPYVVFGHAPTMFDAPANPNHEPEDWIADTFLVVCPEIARSRKVAALLGFRWGYELRAHRARPLPAESIGPEAWDRVLPSLSERFVDWEFVSGFAAL